MGFKEMMAIAVFGILSYTIIMMIFLVVFLDGRDFIEFVGVGLPFAFVYLTYWMKLADDAR